MSSAFVLPGDVLGTLSPSFVAGPGTAVTDNQKIIATLAGTKRIDNNVVSVVRRNDTSGMVVPKIGDVVVCTVVKINQRLANVDIVSVNSAVLRESFNGIIRLEDVRLTEVDKVEISKCFRPGDIVRAQVISLGDSRSFFLSTAANEFGVIFCQTAMDKQPLIPVSWEEVQCPKTGAKEFRKVAKPL